MKSFLLFTFWLGVSTCVWGADVQFTDIFRQTDGVKVRWIADGASRYEVQSGASIRGPWRLRSTLEPIGGGVEWLDAEAKGTSQQFYRLAASAKSGATINDASLFGGDYIPKSLVLLGEQSGEIGASGVFLASQLGAGGLQLVTTGTLSQSAAGWSYGATPADRLVVQFITGTNVSYYITRMQGDFTVDATTFLRRNHNFDYRVVVPGVSDLAYTSDVGTGSPSFQATARGSLTLSNVLYQIDLALAGDYRFDIDSSGSALLNDHAVTGTVTAPGYKLTVNQRRRFELVTSSVNFGGATRTESASADQDWYNNTITLGADTYQWANATKQKSFKNGKPSSIDTYWKASGGVLKNGQPFGTYEMRADAVLGFLRFYLVLPDRLIELESWNALL